MTRCELTASAAIAMTFLATDAVSVANCASYPDDMRADIIRRALRHIDRVTGELRAALDAAEGRKPGEQKEAAE